MLQFLKGFFNKPTTATAVTPEPVAPYKVEAPVPTEVVSTPAPVVEKTIAKKAPAKPRQIVNTPADADKTPAKPKAPRKPRAK